MKYSDFEKHIGKELGGAKETVDVNQLLLDLNLGDIPRKKKIRPFLFWMLIPIILIGSYATFVAMDGDHAHGINKEMKQSLSANDIINRSGAIDIKSNTSNKVKTEKTIGNNTITENANNETFDNAQKLSAEPSRGLRTEETAFVNENSNLRKNTPFLILNKRKEIVVNNRFGTKIVTNNLRDENSQEFIDNQSSSTLSISQEYLEVPTKKNNFSYYKSSNNNTDNTLIGNEIRESVALPSISNRSISISALDSDSDDLFSRMKINCPSFNQAHWRLALVPEIGYFAPNKTLESKRSDASQGFEERQKYEETLEGINLGLYTMLVRDKLPFYLKAGILYSRITERTDLEYNYTLPDTTIGIISQTVSANGDSITTIMGPIISEKTFTGKNRQHSYIHLFDLPVSVGYNTYLGGFDVGLEVGVKFNLMTKANGNLLISQSEYTNLAFHEYYKKRIGLSYFGGVMIGRNFGRFGDFYLAPRFTYYPNDFSNSINAISQKYVTMGVNVGYVYKLR